MRALMSNHTLEKSPAPSATWRPADVVTDDRPGKTATTETADPHATALARQPVPA